MTTKYFTRTILFLLVLLLVKPLFSANSDVVNVSIPDMSGAPGAIVSVPVQVDDVSAKDIYSAGLKLHFNSAVLEAKSVDVSGTILESWGAPTVSILTGDIVIASAGTSPLSGSGALLKINFEVKGPAGSSTTISFTEMLFNEGSPGANTTDGLFTVSGGGSPILIVNPESLNFIVTFGDGNPADQTIDISNGGSGTLTWSAIKNESWLSLAPTSGTGASTITVSINTGGLTAGEYSDTITITAPGASGSPKTVPVSLHIYPESNIVVSIPDSNAASGADIAVPVRVTDVTGQDIYSFGCKLTFDSNVLEATGATSAGSLSETWGAPTAGTASGEIQIGAAGVSALAGSGELLWVNFHVKGGEGTSTTIHFDNFMFNEGSPAATTVDGLFSVTQGGGGDITVTVPDSNAASGADIAVPVRVTDVTGQDIYSFGCKLTFDSNVLEATGATSAGSLSETWGAPTAGTASGEIQIGAAGASALSGSGELLWVNFHVKGGEGASTTIHFDNFMFNEGSPAATTVDGLFSVSEGNAVNKKNEIPKEFSLSQNYPNPFNPSTKIKYSLPQNSQVNITIYNINGNVVKTIINNFQMQGTYEIDWHGTDNENHKAPSGIYFYRIEAGHFIEIRKMTIIK